MDNRLSDFVKGEIKKGTSESELKYHLLANGWKEADVNFAINSAVSKRRNSRIAWSVFGIVLIGVLAFILISYAKTASPEVTPAVSQSGGLQELTTQTVSGDCSLKEDSIEKNECYKTMLNSNSLFDCGSLEDNIEYTYCIRAYEELNLKGVEIVSEI